MKVLTTENKNEIIGWDEGVNTISLERPDGILTERKTSSHQK